MAKSKNYDYHQQKQIQVHRWKLRYPLRIDGWKMKLTHVLSKAILVHWKVLQLALQDRCSLQKIPLQIWPHPQLRVAPGLSPKDWPMRAKASCLSLRYRRPFFQSRKLSVSKSSLDLFSSKMSALNESKSFSVESCGCLISSTKVIRTLFHLFECCKGAGRRSFDSPLSRQKKSDRTLVLQMHTNVDRICRVSCVIYRWLLKFCWSI